MKEPEVRPWIQKLDIKDGDVLLLRWTAWEKFSGERRAKVLTQAKAVFKEALDAAGYPNTQIVVFCSDWDVAVIPAVDLLGALASGVSADQEESP